MLGGGKDGVDDGIHQLPWNRWNVKAEEEEQFHHLAAPILGWGEPAMYVGWKKTNESCIELRQTHVLDLNTSAFSYCLKITEVFGMEKLEVGAISWVKHAVRPSFDGVFHVFFPTKHDCG